MALDIQLKKNEPLPDGIKRIAARIVDDANAQLTNPKNKHKAIHETRKRLKEIRAVIRMVRDELGEELYNRENIAYRDIQLKLAELRDAAVLIEVVDRLKAIYPEKEAQKHFQKVRAQLIAKKKSLSQKYFRKNNLLQDVSHDLETAEKSIEKWPLKGDDFELIRWGIYGVYRRAYEAFAMAYKHPSPEQFHEWRKQVKYFWHHIQILQPLWPPVLEPLANEIHKLSDLLGTDHDLALFRAKLAEDYVPVKRREEIAFLFSIIDHRRKELEKQARPLATQLFADEPVAFTRQIESYWKAWKKKKS